MNLKNVVVLFGSSALDLSTSQREGWKPFLDAEYPFVFSVSVHCTAAEGTSYIIFYVLFQGNIYPQYYINCILCSCALSRSFVSANCG